MASEPLDENQSTNLIERRRWGDGTKVYTRKIFRARRNNRNGSAVASTAAVTDTGPTADEGKKGHEDSIILNGNSLEKSSQAPEAEDGNSASQDSLLQPEATEGVLQEKEGEQARQKEGTSGNGTPGPDSMEVVQESREAAVPLESRESVMEQESREAAGSVVEPQSREAMEIPESGEAMEIPESGDAMEIPESGDAVELSGCREAVDTVLQPECGKVVELPESREAIEFPETREAMEHPDSREAMEHPDSREAMEHPDSRKSMELPESREAMEQPESREAMELQERGEAMELPERGEAMELPESREIVTPEIRGDVELESRGVVEPGSREMVMEPERNEIVELACEEMAAGPESKEVALEPESRGMVVEPESSAMVVEPESRETVAKPESIGMVVEPESREIVDDPESRGMAVEPESRETVVEPESTEMAVERGSDRNDVEPESTGTVTLQESREGIALAEFGEAVQPPMVNGNGAGQANGVLRPPQLNHPQVMEVQPCSPVVTRVEDRVRINVSGTRSRDEISELRMELENELDRVRSLFKKLEAKELELTAYDRSNLISNLNTSVGMVNGNNYAVSTFSGGGGGGGNFGGYSQPQYVSREFVERRPLTRVNSEVGSVGHPETRPFSRSLSVSVVENNHGSGEFLEREKRTPKANQFYRNSEFLLGKDRLPPESNKKLKPNGAGRKQGGEGFGFGYDRQQRERAFRSCSSLLQRLMKHKFGWVFNEPVDAKKLGLHDYHDIIKHPMDLGTIKTRLSRNYYKSPIEFAEDVRLVFHNAMTYNPKGQDVHIMAETLLQIFEERWAVIQTEYNPDWRYQMYHDAGLPTPTSRKAPPAQFYTPTPAHAPAPISVPVTPVPRMRALDRSESMTTSVDPKLKPLHFPHVGRAPVLKKPKAKDPNKRDMTYEEKQKLSTNLQNLPSEKLDAIVQIIKKRNSTLSQHDDEIEVDIDSVDAETLWELDRFVTNYKKNLSKNKRKAEIALQARALAAQTTPATKTAPAVVDALKENRIDESTAPSVQVEKQGDNVSRSSSSSSSSSDSGSSSSDSDSDSSSAYGSDAGRSPRT